MKIHRAASKLKKPKAVPLNECQPGRIYALEQQGSNDDCPRICASGCIYISGAESHKMVLAMVDLDTGLITNWTDVDEPRKQECTYVELDNYSIVEAGLLRPQKGLD
jgi:hypothetical protein